MNKQWYDLTVLTKVCNSMTMTTKEKRLANTDIEISQHAFVNLHFFQNLLLFICSISVSFSVSKHMQQYDVRTKSVTSNGRTYYVNNYFHRQIRSEWLLCGADQWPPASGDTYVSFLCCKLTTRSVTPLSVRRKSVN